MFLHTLSEKCYFLDLKNFMYLMIYEKHLTPGRYRELHFGQAKKNDVNTNSNKIQLLINAI